MRLAMSAAVLVGCAACARMDAPPPGWTERDSAGVLIVENTTAAWTEETKWTVDPSPLLDIGRAEGDAPYLLHDLRPVIRTRDGRIVVPSSALGEIRIFDPAVVADGYPLRQRGSPVD